MKLPLLNKKYTELAVINPEDLIAYIEKLRNKKRPKIPKYAVFSFWPEMYDVVKKKYKVRETKFLSRRYPILIFNHRGMKTAFLCLPAGAPWAGVLLEEMLALGCEYAIFFGAPGVLTPTIKRGEIIVPTKALRDEGTSYHYEKPSRYSYPSKLVLRCIEKTLRANNLPYLKGGTWTTDALFRETPRKVKIYYKEDCISVDMEASALFSIAKSRKKHIGAIFHAADCIGGKKWEPRMTKKMMRKEKANAKRVLKLSLESLYALHRGDNRN